MVMSTSSTGNRTWHLSSTSRPHQRPRGCKESMCLLFGKSCRYSLFYGLDVFKWLQLNHSAAYNKYKYFHKVLHLINTHLIKKIMLDIRTIHVCQDNLMHNFIRCTRRHMCSVMIQFEKIVPTFSV